MCQEFPKEKWIDAQKENVLDAPYYHVVFTVPEELNPGSMSILWAQKVELFSQHNICRENYFLGC